MLVLTRKAGQAVQCGPVVVRVLSVRGHTVRLGFSGSRSVPIARIELLDTEATASHVMEGRADGKPTFVV